MPYSINFELQENVLSFEIIGRICSHVDSIARYVMHHLAKYQTENVLIDLRRADDRPGPAQLFIHVLKYPPVHHLKCALIDLAHNHEFFSLYLKLMRDRGHKIQFFSCPEEAKAWFRTEEDRITAHKQPRRRSSGIFARAREIATTCIACCWTRW
jgi:hypothetical protein